MAKEKHLILDNDGFFVKNERFAYDDIVSTEFYYVQTQKNVNFGASGVDHNVDITIHLSSRSKPIKINTGPQYLTLYGFTLGKDSTEAIIAKFHEISTRTFKQRLKKYTDALSEHGFFHYDGKKIYKDGRIETEKWVANFLNDSPWLKRPFVIFLEKRSSSFFRSAIRHEIATKKDSDVFFSLLKHFYRLEWR